MLTNLKKFRFDLRKDNEDGESRLLQSRKKQVRVSHHPKKHQETEEKPQLSKRFIAKVSELLEMLRRNEVNYEDLKASLTTRVWMKKINIHYLKEDRAKLHSLVQQFEKQNDLKM